MPELPEVEAVRQILRSEILGKTIQKIEIHKSEDEAKRRVSLIEEMDEEKFINLLKGKTIYEVERKGKWLFFILTNQEKIKTHVLISHLGMTGKYFVEEKLLTPEQKKLFNKHNSEESRVLTFYLGNEQSSTKLIYCDARRFGSFHLQNFEDYKKLQPYKNIGTDLLEGTVDAKVLFEHYQKRKVFIKPALLEQNLISGIGNIYASEILFDTKIHPLKKTNQLVELEVKNIVSSAQSTLRKALKLGGTSEFDFVNPLGKEGSYQTKLKVYNRLGKPCPNCGSSIKELGKLRKEGRYPICLFCKKVLLDWVTGNYHPNCWEIKKAKINEKKPEEKKERSTFFCPQCQGLEI